VSSIALPTIVSPDRAAAGTFHLGYRPWLDGLRGIAILMVLAHHTEPVLLPRGWLGVDLFFVLSGFLITSLLIEEWKTEQRISFRLFYARRALRLFPALAVMLFVAALLMYFLPGVGQNYRSILYCATYVSNWIMALDLDKVSSTLILTWSLSVEEQFYLVWPIMLYAALRWRLRPCTMLITLAGLIVLVCTHRSILVAQGATVLRVAFASDTRADSLLAGCCVGVLANYGLLPGFSALLRLMIGVLSVVFLLYLAGFGQPEGVGLSLVAVFFAGLLALLLSNPPKPLISVLSSKSLVWIGRLSYSLYLWHLYAYFAIQMSGVPQRFRILAAVPLAFALATASYYFIERPSLTFKARFAAIKTDQQIPPLE
jgi:peptidoglycan/LPS O-acetylase OafA/YrhL